MILQALKEYYDRKAADSGIAPFGWEWKEIPFLVIVDEKGRFVGVEDTRELKGKKKVAHSFLLPKGVKRSSGILANTGWDNVEYATGIVCKGKPSRVKEQHRAFVETLGQYVANREFASVIAFLRDSKQVAALQADRTFAEAIETCAFVTFKLAGGNHVIAENVDFKVAYSETASSHSCASTRCLVSGALVEPSILHPAIKGVAGANTTGGNIVSFNFPAACSFGKAQGLNAPVGETSAFAYTTVLNTLLGKSSKQKMYVGDMTVVFWSSRDNALEDEFGNLFAEPPKDDPDRLTENVRALYRSVNTGAFVTDGDETRFYVLGLAPNSARLSVRFWMTGSVAELSRWVRSYFDDLSVVHGSYDKDHLSLWRLLVSTAQQGKSENVNPRLSGEMMRSILSGLPFPETLLQAVLVRIKAEREVGYARAKLIKGYLCRKFDLPPDERNRLIMLDKENINVGYRLGRLFATLEKIQCEANPGVNATIRDRFYAAASSSPVTVFGNLMRMSNHWLSKIESDKPGLAVTRKRLLGEIAGGIVAFPAHLAIADQSYFALGYYHQQQDFYTKKDTKETDNQKGSEE